MPRLSCWFVRASLIHLSVGAVFGGLILSAKGFPVSMNWAWLLLAAHIQVMVGGWLVQLTLGMAYWLFRAWTLRAIAAAPAGPGQASQRSTAVLAERHCCCWYVHGGMHPGWMRCWS